MTERYQAYIFPALGGRPVENAVVWEGTLDECREAAIARLQPGWAHPSPDFYWLFDPSGGDIEAYGDSEREGCGGVAIKRI